MRTLSILICIALPLFVLAPAAAQAQGQSQRVPATAAEDTAPADTVATAAPVAAALVTSGQAAPADTAAQADTAAPISTVGPGFVGRFSLSPEFGVYLARGVNVLHIAGRADYFLGHDLFAVGTESSRLALSVGYLGSLSINHVETLHRHGAALSIHSGDFLVTVGGGMTIAHDYQTRSAITGGHIAVQLGFQWGNFTLTVPISVDFFPTGGGLLHLFNLGLALGVSTN